MEVRLNRDTSVNLTKHGKMITVLKSMLSQISSLRKEKTLIEFKMKQQESDLNNGLLKIQ